MTINILIDAFRELLMILPAILFTITVHEYFQGLTAVKLGDTTPIDTGMNRFNPLPFIENLGFICFVLFRYGWARNITIDPRNFKKPKVDQITVILAGLGANLVAAFLFILLIVLYRPHPDGYIYGLFMATIQINLNYFFLSLLPLFPLAGGRIVTIFYPRYHKTEIIGIILLLVIFIFNFTKIIDIVVFRLINIFI